MDVKIYLYDNEVDCIGSGSLSPMYVQWQLEAAQGNDVEVHISSVGGSAFDALAIYNLLKQYNGNVTTHIDSLAASAASIVAMAGKTVYMSKFALLMIHKPMVSSGGNADDLTNDAEMLNKVQEQLSAVYVDKTGLSIEKIEELINATTWLSSDEAKELGFVDEIEDYKEDSVIVSNSALIGNYAETAPLKYKTVINKILVKPAPATTENKMKQEEIDAIVNPTNSFLKKVMNYITGVTSKIVTNKGDMFVVGNLVNGAPIFNNAEMEVKASDDEDVEATLAGGKKVKMKIKDGKVTDMKDDEDDDSEDDDDDIDPENRVVTNKLGINIRKTLGPKAIKNSLVVKLKEVNNKVEQQDQLIVELRSQLIAANTGLQKKISDVKDEIISEFAPANSQRSNTNAKTGSALPSWATPKDENSVSANAAKKAVNRANV